jgi:hypothetical protein
MLFDLGNSRAGQFVDLRFEMSTLVLLHTCPHPLSSSVHYPRNPVGLQLSQAPPVADDDFCRNSRPENVRGFANTELYRWCGGGGE